MYLQPCSCFLISVSACLPIFLFTFPSTSLSFPSLLILLIANSLFIAVFLSGCSSTYTNFTGRRILVYFAPRPLLCAATRRWGSVVQPV